MVQTEGQQQTFQRAIDERSQNRRGLGRVGDPDAEVVDAGLDHRPEQRQNDGDDHRVADDHHGHEALAVEEGQCIRQLAEIVVFIVCHAAHETGDDTHEHAHVQRRSTQHRGKVAVDGDLLPEQGVGHGVGIFQHGAGDAEDVAGDDVDEGKRQHGRKGTAGTLLRPAAADGHSEQDVQIVDDRPADVLHGGADGHDRCNVAAAHLHQLAQTDHQTGSGHDGDDGHQHLAQLLQKVEVDEALLFRLLCAGLLGRRCCFRCLGGLCLFCRQGQHRRLACRRNALGTVQLHIVCAAGQNDGSDGFQAPLPDERKVCLGHRLTGLDPVALFHQDLEALAVQADGLQTHMDQDFQPIVCRKANGVFRFGDGLHRAIHRAAEQPIGRLDGDAFAQNAAGKGLIRDFAQRDECSAEGCCHDNRTCRCGHDVPPYSSSCIILRNYCILVA